MLKHGIQELEGSQILLPHLRKLRPDPDRLATRFEQFLRTG
jgi:putative restriction endonuclease